MRSWTRATREQPCGACGHRILPGEPLLRIQIRTVRGLVRCTACAGEDVPVDLPPFLQLAPRTSGDFTHIVAAIGARREWMPYREED